MRHSCQANARPMQPRDPFPKGYRVMLVLWVSKVLRCNEENEPSRHAEAAS